MSNMENSQQTKPIEEPFPNCIKIKHNSFYYVIPEHEFISHWLPNVPKVSKMAGLKRGKYFSRWIKEMNRKGTGKHGQDFTK